MGKPGDPSVLSQHRSPIPTSLGVSPVLKWLKTTWCHILCNLYPGRNLILCTVRSFFRIPLIVFVFVTPPKFHTKNIVTIIHCSNQSIMWIRWRGRKAGDPQIKIERFIFLYFEVYSVKIREAASPLVVLNHDAPDFLTPRLFFFLF